MEAQLENTADNSNEQIKNETQQNVENERADQINTEKVNFKSVQDKKNGDGYEAQMCYEKSCIFKILLRSVQPSKTRLNVERKVHYGSSTF